MAKIYWAGQSCFQIEVSNSKDHSATIVVDPFEPDYVGLKLPKMSADIIFITHDDKDHNNVKGVNGEPFVVEGPGEYEVKGVFAKGISSTHRDNGDKGKNTMYIFEAEGLKFCHLGDFGQKELSDSQLENIDGVDVLMIPIGGTHTIDSQEAQKIISQIEPKIIIPMHYKLPGLKNELDDVSKFLKTMGKGAVPAQDKFVVKTSTLPKDGMEIVVLQP